MPNILSEQTLRGYQGAQESAALADLGAWGKLRFWGPDARRFLNGLLTNDVLNLKAGQGCPACLLTPKGKLRAFFQLYALDDELLAVGHPAAIKNVGDDLGRVTALSRTKMADIGAEYALSYLAGPKALSVLAAAFGVQGPFEPYEIRRAQWRSAEIIICSEPRMLKTGFLLLLPSNIKEKGFEALMISGGSVGLQKISPETLDILRVEAGVPLWGVELNEDTIPLEAGLDNAVSFNKGCYLGQETMSRIHHLGHVNRILVSLKISRQEKPPIGAPILKESREVGKVTSVVWSPKHQAWLALSFIHPEINHPRAEFQLLFDTEAVTSILVRPAPGATIVR